MTRGAPRAAVVIGGGITGLVCTWRLRRVGVDALCLESSSRPGGALSSRHVDGFVLEAGANTVQENAALGHLIRDVGLVDELRRAPRDLTRFVYRFGALHPLPTSILSGLTSRLISARAKGRVLGELVVKRRTERDDESVKAFVCRRFGAELLDAVVAPFVSGTFAGDPAALSARAVLPSLVVMEERYGSILRGVLASIAERRARPREAQRGLISFREGLETLPVRLAADLGTALEAGAEALSIARDPAGEGLEVEVRNRMERRRLASRSVVVACSASAAASLLDGLAHDASRVLAAVPAASLATVSLAWPRADVSHSLDGVGFLVAAGERVRTLGCLWNSSIFPARAPAHQASFTAFLGGARDPQAALLSDDALVALAARELAAILGARGAPRTLGVERHPRALPQYVVGHAERMTAVGAGLAAVPGLFLAGNYLGGVSVGECVRQGERAAEDVRAFLGETVDFSTRRM